MGAAGDRPHHAARALPLVRHLANGGMASVWEAHDELLDRRVAIKVLASHLSEDERARRRFAREARAAAGLSSHPNVVTIYDVGEHDGESFIVMELLRGGTVADRLRCRARGSRTAWRCGGCTTRAPRSTPRTSRHRAPRRQAGQHAARRRRPARDRRLRDRAAGPRGPAHADRAGARHRRIHLARAGDGRARDAPRRTATRWRWWRSSC